MPALICIAIPFPKAIYQDCRILAAVVYNTGHWDDAPVNPKLFLKLRCMVPELNQNFINRFRYFQVQEIQPLLVDKAHIINRLDCLLSRTKLFNPGQRPNMPIYIRTHNPILWIFVKNSFQVRHIGVNILFQRDDCAVLTIS